MSRSNKLDNPEVASHILRIMRLISEEDTPEKPFIRIKEV
ncbi:hypothetical protein RV00_GL002858 [Enterococcus devriesei]|uniref:Uncharacterized protein n=1 Tax=Enterococcus devriesei TaxID=319970 RepID=A0A1L8STY9_9ENTE|nr:hypothetical protein RV00_GL002858 [Enterococcus devriesei]